MNQDQFWALSEAARCKGWSLSITDLPERIDEPFFPLPEDLFRSLELVSPNQVRFVVVGQDPYFSEEGGRPVATGLAFGVREGVQPPKSLARIKHYIHGSNDLAGWSAAKGVLLLNAALTVPAAGQRSAAGRHLTHWDRFFKAVLAQVRTRRRPAAVIAWGCRAKQSVADALDIKDWDYPPHPCVWSYHPVASKVGPKSFDSFWKTPVGKALLEA